MCHLYGTREGKAMGCYYVICMLSHAHTALWLVDCWGCLFAGELPFGVQRGRDHPDPQVSHGRWGGHVFAGDGVVVDKPR